MLRRFVKSGDYFEKVATARFLRETQQATEDALFNVDRHLTPQIRRMGEFPSVFALAQDQLSEQSDRGHVRSIDTPHVTPSTGSEEFRARMIFNANTPVLGKFGLWDIASNVQIGRLHVGGVVACKLFVPTNGAFIDRADIDTGDNTRLRAQLNGSAQILWQDTGTGTAVDAIVRLGNPQNVDVVGTANGAISAGSSGTMRVWQNGIDTLFDLPELVHHTWMDGGQDISSGKEIVARWFPYEGIWRVMHAECEDAATALAQLADDGTVPTQGTVAATSEVVAAFAASQNLGTANITKDAANARFTLPTITDPAGAFYQYSVTGQMSVADATTNVKLIPRLNAIEEAPLLDFTIAAASTPEPINAMTYKLLAQQSSPQVDLWVETDKTTTITWQSLQFQIKRLLV